MNNINKILGCTLMVISVLILTIDKISIRISESIVEAGYASHGIVRGSIPINDDSPGILVYFLFFIGFVLLAAGFPGGSKQRGTQNNLQKEDRIRRIPTPYSYSSAAIAGDYVFLGLHRGFGGTFTQQMHDTFSSLKVTLSKCNLSLDSIVKVNVYLKNIEDLPEMEKVFLEYFGTNNFPARMTSTTSFIDSDCLMMIDGVSHISLMKTGGIS